MEQPLGKHPPDVRPRLRLKVILVALVLCRGLVLLCVLPPFEGWDEFQHVAYIVHLNESGRRPILGETLVSHSLQSRLSTFPHGPYALKMLKSTGAVDYATFWTRPPLATRKATVLPPSTPLSLYEAQHGPLYYRLVAPLFAFAGGVGDLRTSIGVLRLVNLLLTASSVWIALGMAERLIRDRVLSELCGLLIATQPLFLINGVRVANDALGMFFATAAVAAATRSPHVSIARFHVRAWVADWPSHPGEISSSRADSLRRDLCARGSLARRNGPSASRTLVPSPRCNTLDSRGLPARNDGRVSRKPGAIRQFHGHAGIGS